MEDVEYFSHLGAEITNDGKCTSDSKYRTAMAKADFKNNTHHFNFNLCGTETWALRRLPQNYLENCEM